MILLVSSSALCNPLHSPSPFLQSLILQKFFNICYVNLSPSFLSVFAGLRFHIHFDSRVQGRERHCNTPDTIQFLTHVFQLQPFYLLYQRTKLTGRVLQYTNQFIELLVVGRTWAKLIASKVVFSSLHILLHSEQVIHGEIELSDDVSVT